MIAASTMDDCAEFPVSGCGEFPVDDCAELPVDVKPLDEQTPASCMSDVCVCVVSLSKCN